MPYMTRHWMWSPLVVEHNLLSSRTRFWLWIPWNVIIVHHCTIIGVVITCNTTERIWTRIWHKVMGELTPFGLRMMTQNDGLKESCQSVMKLVFPLKKIPYTAIISRISYELAHWEALMAHRLCTTRGRILCFTHRDSGVISVFKFP